MFNHFSPFLSASICLGPNEWREGKDIEKDIEKEGKAKEIKVINGTDIERRRDKCSAKKGERIRCCRRVNDK